MPTPNFARQWESARHELLDLTFRNPLLKYRALKSRGLEFTDADLPATLEALWDEKTLRFAPKSETQSAQLPRLQTPYEDEELNKRALKTFYDGRSSLEEQGVNTLYLAFGFLKWFEADASERELRSPLFLLPVELKREKAGQSFGLRATGEEGGTNLSLATLLRRDLRLELPEWEEECEIDLALYFDKVRAAIAPYPRFEIEENLALAFFSFAKFLMFRDLEDQIESAQNHPVIGALLGDGFGSASDRIGDGEKLDELLPITRSSVVADADSSQLLAVEDARRGHNLVIQGPPGTGKSQTITNVIAQAVAQGQKVLFVSEKMAALQVVKSRLDALGLGDFCLELHSNKTNKKALLAELQRTFELPRPDAATSRENAVLLDDAVEKLNAHCAAINTPIAHSELTLFQVYGRWLHNDDAITAANLQIPPLGGDVLAEKTPLEIVRLRALIVAMQEVLRRIGPHAQHPFRDTQLRAFSPAEARNLRASLDQMLALLPQIDAHNASLAAALDHTTPTSVSETQTLLEVASAWSEAPDLSGIQTRSDEWTLRAPTLESLLKNGETLRDLHAQWNQTLQPTAWAGDVAASRAAIANHGAKWFRWIIGEWRQSQKQLATLTRAAPTKVMPEQLALLDAVIQFGETKPQFEAHSADGAALFGARWNGENSDFDALRTLAQWLQKIGDLQKSGDLPSWFFEIERQPQPQTLLMRDELQQRLAQLQTLGAAVLGVLDCSEDWPDAWSEIKAQLQNWTREIGRVGEIVAFNGASAQLNEAELNELDDLAHAWDDAARGLELAFERAHLEALLDVGTPPELGAFDGAAQDSLRRDFARRDIAHLQQTARKIAREHYKSLARCADNAEMKTLRHEWGKQRAHLAPRRLIERIPQLLQTLKPVMMMSPLSVAAYLPADAIQFDLIIFDEASQVRPIDAFGALLRGQQAVVAGDSRQLPPTSFFDKMADEDDETDEELETGAGDLESILGLFAAQGAPQRMLRWHYRSRHESLIAVSNREFYDNKLIVFPSPDAGRSQMGLICHLLSDTVYQSSINREEAKAVAAAVIQHARAQLELPVSQRRSLGVAAFSIKQANEIRDQIETLRRENEQLEPFFASEVDEPFFVKNLENVQGDERDTIFLSVGYGRDENGKVAMRFGPLGQSGGERRLNVLISRARARCEVFTNLRADDLDLSRTNAVGVRALKQFLSYAQSGHFVAALPSNREMDSPFEEEVLVAIESLGYRATPQVGSAGYFIDLAVVHPDHAGRYVLGVECDGASYHSSANARDRDRLRAQVLGGMGWRLHRIWSTDWFGNRASQITRLKAAIESAIAP